MQKENRANSNKRFSFIREFDAPKKDVFNAFSNAEALNAWWGPVECKNSVVSLDFRPGGIFHFQMDFNGHLSYGRFLFKEIRPYDLLEFSNAFADEKANVVKAPFDMEFPKEIFYRIELTERNGKTTLNLTGTPMDANAAEEESFQAIEADMQQGFGSTFDKLGVYMKTQKEIHSQLKPNNMARVTTYLNFPGNTEEAFHFYKKVFKGEFTGKGLQHFADVNLPEGHPPMSETDKKLIIHAELTILGGHVLMATDAPESMGFKLITGNNMHVNLEPDSREETKRLFDALSEGGTITMPMEDMFFGTYFGECTDKYGVNWMFSFIEK
jgi:uncharacterized glyoxalase superfamily protein PhnB/uncharacterized protein YndB with AHSA1/START domain